MDRIITDFEHDVLLIYDTVAATNEAHHARRGVTERSMIRSTGRIVIRSSGSDRKSAPAI